MAECPGHPAEDCGRLHASIGDIVYCDGTCQFAAPRFYRGQEVLTRKHKTGIVCSTGPEYVSVQFGGETGPIYPMRPGNLVDKQSYMGGGASPRRHA